METTITIRSEQPNDDATISNIVLRAYPSQTISGQAAPGYASGDAVAEMERIAGKALSSSQSFEWTGIAYQEKQAGGQIGALLGLSLVVVFLLLAALYESWPIPLSVLLIVPFGVLGAVLFTLLRGLSADIYFNVDLITIIGLAAKNAILIVEFAKDNEDGDRDARPPRWKARASGCARS